MARNEATSAHANRCVKCRQNHTAASHSARATASSRKRNCRIDFLENNFPPSVPAGVCHE